MYKNVLESIQGIEIYPLISLGIFLVFFAVMIYKITKMDKALIKKLESIPLEGQNREGEKQND